MPAASALIGVGSKTGSIPCIPITEAGLPKWQAKQVASTRNWIASTRFKARPQQFCLVPDKAGKLNKVLIGVGDNVVLPALGTLSRRLPSGNYHLDCSADVRWDDGDCHLAALGYALGGYRFERYKSQADKTGGGDNASPSCSGLDETKLPKLWFESTAKKSPQHPDDKGSLHDEIEAVYFVRDLINTPAADMMPEDLAQAAKDLATKHSAKFKQTTGKTLVKGYPMIHAVGRASAHPPRLIELKWGKSEHPLLALVGKGICFDSGGLNLKSARGMRQMKKDMGGAAHVLGLASLIMSRKLPVRLLVLVAAAENAVAGDSYRPGDVLQSRRGIQVEIDNTDAEGRLVLADALTYASEAKPELMIDFATLTGAARVALGPAVGAMFTNHDEVAAGLAEASSACEDAIWRLPLYAPYQTMLASHVADCANAGSSTFAGAITAALFLQKFVGPDIPWVHFDVMGWNARTKPTGPVGGEAQGLRATYRFVTTYLAKR